MRRLAVILLILLIGYLTRALWVTAIGWSLVCREEVAPSDVILVENFDPSYLLFERAATLQQARLAARVLVPAQAAAQAPNLATPVSRGIAELMARLARVRNVEIFPVREIEPYTLNAAYQLRSYFTNEHLRSIIVVAPALRSRRSFLVYEAVLGAAGIQVHCVPVFGPHTPENWATSWHGIAVVTQQLAKLQFYRFNLLRRGVGAGPRDSPGASTSEGGGSPPTSKRACAHACE